MKCPRDNSVLLRRHHHNAVVHACETCHGLWLTAESFQEFRRQNQELPKPQLAPSTRTQMPPHGKVYCLADGAEMQTQDRLGILVDLCPKCRAVWLDGGELEEIVKRQCAGVAENARELAAESRRVSSHKNRRAAEIALNILCYGIFRRHRWKRL